MSENGKNDGLFDSFWDLASLIPKKKKPIPPPYSMVQSEPVEISDRRPVIPQSTNNRLSFSRAPETLEREYNPKESPFILNVKLYKRQNSYSFYSQFRDDAIRYLHEVSPECEPVSYFSYIPQYGQMTAAQLRFYFYFRACIKAGNFPSCDISYIWLYIYEIINLPDLITPEQGVISLCRVWASYREKYPKIDKYMTVWLADYCLVHELPCPYEWIKGFLPVILENAGFREFYLGHASELNEYGVHTILSCASKYDIQKSKFISSLDSIEQKHLFCSLVAVLSRLLSEGAYHISPEKTSVLSRDAFSGSLCAHNVKCRIEVTYRSFTQSSAISESITAALKYAENRMRALKKQKSRLTVTGLNPEDKKAIDAYIDRLVPSVKPQTPPPPEYEKLYEADSHGISFADALEIEDASWDNTKLLISEEEESEEMPSVNKTTDILQSDEASADPSEIPTTEAEETLTEAQADLLSRVFAGNRIAATFENTALAERINEYFINRLGDIVIEISDSVLLPITDYGEDLAQWLLKQ